MQNASKIVIILGNGFDLDLGLKTSYYDFVHSDYFEYLLTAKLPNHTFIEGRYAEKMQVCPNRLAEFVKTEEKEKKWVDLEVNIRDFCFQYSSERNSELIANELYALRYMLFKYLQHWTIVDLQKYNPDLERHITYNLLKTLLLSNDDWHIWNFNYTSLCADLLQIICNNESVLQRLHYIHGTLDESQSSEDINIVLGTNYDKKVAQVCPTAIKSQVAKYDNIVLLKEHISKGTHVILFGESAGATDIQYFQSLVESESLQQLTIISYNQESCDNVYANLEALPATQLGKKIESGEIKLNKLSCVDYINHTYYNDIERQRYINEFMEWMGINQ